MYKKPQKTKEPNSEDHAHGYALFLLNLRLRTQQELTDKLIEKGYNQSIVKNEINRLIDLKYLNDQTYAQIFVENCVKFKTYGFYFVKQKMFLKKLPKNLCEKILEEFFDEENELKIAKKYLLKIAKKAPTGYIEKQKIALKLKNRGFRSNVISKCLA